MNDITAKVAEDSPKTSEDSKKKVKDPFEPFKRILSAAANRAACARENLQTLVASGADSVTIARAEVSVARAVAALARANDALFEARRGRKHQALRHFKQKASGDAARERAAPDQKGTVRRSPASNARAQSWTGSPPAAPVSRRVVGRHAPLAAGDLRSGYFATVGQRPMP